MSCTLIELSHTYYELRSYSTLPYIHAPGVVPNASVLHIVTCLCDSTYAIPPTNLSNLRKTMSHVTVF